MANNYEISLQQAIDLTTMYRNNQPSNVPICETFDVEAINKLIFTDGCKFLRIYLGMKENMEVVTILVAVNENDEDILPVNNAGAENNPIIIENGIRCPPVCPPPSPLNND